MYVLLLNRYKYHDFYFIVFVFQQTESPLEIIQ